MRRYSLSVWTYIAVIVTAACVLITRGPFSRIHPVDVIVLALLFLACESAPIPLVRRQAAAWSPSSSVTLASVVLLGPVGAAMVGTFSALSFRRTLIIPQRLFNGGMCALSGYLAGQVFRSLGGHIGPPGHTDFPKIIGPFAAAAAIQVLINHGLVAGVLWLSRAERRTGTLNRIGLDLRLMSWDLGYASFGLLIAALWSNTGAYAAILVLIPLFVARWAISQSSAQQSAYEAVMAALCKAVETKDFYTRGHSERVSRGSAMLAREIGMHPARVEAITYAGMLHDVGKLGVPTTVLQKSGKLTEEEYAAIQLHPMRGLEIVREIGFLDEALAGIMHHHERIDGRGYPLGLAGDEIPEFARVIAVADAFDSMTSNRSYRGARPVGDAIAELRKWSGSQFDPALVDAFVMALEREGWVQPEPVVPPADPAVEITAQDHDDPTAPLRIAESR